MFIIDFNLHMLFTLLIFTKKEIMIIKETPPDSAKNKYNFSDIEIGQCNILNDITYTEYDLRRALSASYQYRKYYKNIESLKFSIHLDNNCLKIYRVK